MVNDIESLAFAPPHPGEVLREDILPDLGMSHKELAEHLGVARQTVSKLVNEKQSVSLDMAKRLGKAFENGTRFWLALQMQYDIWFDSQKNVIDIKPLRKNTESAA